jgi:hypothetical protein
MRGALIVVFLSLDHHHQIFVLLVILLFFASSFSSEEAGLRKNERRIGLLSERLGGLSLALNEEIAIDCFQREERALRYREASAFLEGVIHPSIKRFLTSQIAKAILVEGVVKDSLDEAKIEFYKQGELLISEGESCTKAVWVTNG